MLKCQLSQYRGDWKSPPAAFPAFPGTASRLSAEAFRRASPQAGRRLVVLTYSSVCSACPNGCGLSFEKLGLRKID